MLNSGIAPRPPLYLTVIALASLTPLGCDDVRERPGEPTDPSGASATVVRIVEPDGSSPVASDSGQAVVVQVEGEVQAVEYLLVHISSADTLAGSRRQFPATLSSVEVVFGVRIPGLVTGERLEFRGVAENADGARFLSVPVRVSVVECDRFPEACAGG